MAGGGGALSQRECSHCYCPQTHCGCLIGLRAIEYLLYYTVLKGRSDTPLLVQSNLGYSGSVRWQHF